MFYIAEGGDIDEGISFSTLDEAIEYALQNLHESEWGIFSDPDGDTLAYSWEDAEDSLLVSVI